MTGAEHAAADFSEKQAELAADNATRQEKKHMFRTIDAAALVRDQKDRRHRPRRAKKESTKRARKLKLTTRLKRRRKKRR